MNENLWGKIADAIVTIAAFIFRPKRKTKITKRKNKTVDTTGTETKVNNINPTKDAT